MRSSHWLDKVLESSGDHVWVDSGKKRMGKECERSEGSVNEV